MTQPTIEQLKERIELCMDMVATMASNGRPPRMQIPAADTAENEDVYICNTLRLLRAALAEKQGVDDGELWSFMRSTLKQGVDIWHDHVNRHHEEYEARIDAAACERADKLKAALTAQREG